MFDLITVINGAAVVQAASAGPLDRLRPLLTEGRRTRTRGQVGGHDALGPSGDHATAAAMIAQRVTAAIWGWAMEHAGSQPSLADSDSC